MVNTPGRNAGAVAEFTIGMILAQTRLITTGHTALSTTGDWSGHLYRADTTGRELAEMTVGVIGYGHIGTKVVRLLKAFGCRILVNDPYVQLSPGDLDDGVEQVSLEAILAECDVVTMHPRVTEETTGMIGAEQFAAMKDGAYFINTARGPLVDYDALYEALVTKETRRRRPRNLRDRARADRLATPQAPERHPHPPHRRRVGQNRHQRRRHARRRGPPFPQTSANP